MKETFLYALRAILPILLIIASGYAVRKLGSWELSFFKTLNKLCFRLFLPINLFCNIYGVEDLSSTNWRLIGALVVGIFVSMCMGLLLVQLLVKRPDQKGVLVQTSFRSNQAVLGLPLANALGGQEAMGFASLASGLCVPVFNMLAVIILTVYSGNGKKLSVKDLLGRIVRNPLIIGSGLGIAVLALRQFGVVPAFFVRDQLPSVYKALNDLGKIASPAMLFVLGTGLDFKATGALLPQLSLGIFMRLILSPVVVIGSVLLLRVPLGLSVMEMPSFVAMFASPIAVSSAVMVQEIGGDDQLASQMVVWTSVCSMVTIFMITYILRSLGAL